MATTTTELCPHCSEHVVSSSYRRHVARCELFAPISEFIKYWNEGRAISETATRYGVKRDRVKSMIQHLRHKCGYDRGNAKSPGTGRQKKMSAKPEYAPAKTPPPYPGTQCRCGVCGYGNPCHMCKQTADGQDYIGLARGRVFETIGT